MCRFRSIRFLIQLIPAYLNVYSVFMFARSVLKITSAVITHCQIKNQKVLCKKYVLFDTHTDSLLYGTLAYNLAPAWFWRKQKKSRYILLLFLRLCHNSVKEYYIKSFLYYLFLKVRKSSQNRTQTCCLPLTPDIQSLLQRNSAFFLSSY